MNFRREKCFYHIWKDYLATNPMDVQDEVVSNDQYKGTKSSVFRIS